MLLKPTYGGEYSLDQDDIRCLLEGRFTIRKCTYCDGTGFVHFQDGEIIGTGKKRDIDNDIDFDGCDDCFGLGQTVTLQL